MIRRVMPFPPRPAVIAHRGDCAAAHENTIDAFRDAIAAGADGIEFDVRRTADARLVVHHDDAIGQSLLARVDYQTAQALAEALGYSLPLLSEVLAVTRGRIQLDVELKEGGYEADVLALLDRAGFALDDYVVTTFDPATLLRVRAVAPTVRTGLLLEKTEWGKAFEAFRRSTAHFLAPHRTMIDEPGLAAAHEQGVALVAWTVNDPAMMRRLFLAPAVTAVITDRTADALRVRGETLARGDSTP